LVFGKKSLFATRGMAGRQGGHGKEIPQGKYILKEMGINGMNGKWFLRRGGLVYH